MPAGEPNNWPLIQPRAAAICHSATSATMIALTAVVLVRLRGLRRLARVVRVEVGPPVRMTSLMLLVLCAGRAVDPQPVLLLMLPVLFFPPAPSVPRAPPVRAAHPRCAHA